MILVFDTETTGMVRWHDPVDHPQQPRVVQLGMGLYHPDDGVELAAISLLVKSDVPVEPEAGAVHGITDELLREAGLEPKLAIYLLREMAKRATKVVAHNINFDRKMAMIEFLRCGIDDGPLMQLPSFCTMQATTPICRILKSNPRHASDYKWPKLIEAYKYFFESEMTGAHDALSDVRGCARIYFHLQQQARS